MTPPLPTHVQALAVAGWLKASLTTFGTTVASFLPGGFPAYARVHHPFGGGSSSRVPSPWRERAARADVPLQTPADGYEFAMHGLENAQAAIGTIPVELINVLVGHRPADHAWCVATEVDAAWTFVGGPSACIAALLSDHRLDAVETHSTSRW